MVLVCVIGVKILCAWFANPIILIILSRGRTCVSTPSGQIMRVVRVAQNVIWKYGQLQMMTCPHQNYETKLRTQINLQVLVKGLL
eukprot:6255139-Karenia_brevis.AAC.1